MGLAGRLRDDDLDDLVLALNEAATNAVLHGSGGGHPVEVVVHVTGGWAEMTVLDRGPVQRPPRGWYDDEAEAESAPVTGRGHSRHAAPTGRRPRRHREGGQWNGRRPEDGMSW